MYYEIMVSSIKNMRFLLLIFTLKFNKSYFIMVYTMEVWVRCCLSDCNLTVSRTGSNQVYTQMIYVGKDNSMLEFSASFQVTA